MAGTVAARARAGMVRGGVVVVATAVAVAMAVVATVAVAVGSAPCR